MKRLILFGLAGAAIYVGYRTYTVYPNYVGGDAQGHSQFTAALLNAISPTVGMAAAAAAGAALGWLV